MRKLSSLLFLASLAILATISASFAQERGHWRHDHPHGYDWDHWRHGGWINGWHEGRFGWWWVIDGAWFSYPTPVYPYPEPPVVVVTPTPQAPPGNYYYCPNPSGYYPNVQQCLVGWQMIPVVPQAQAVPAAPAPAAPMPPAAPPPPPGR
jgi:hypothetical protein